MSNFFKRKFKTWTHKFDFSFIRANRGSDKTGRA